MQIEAEELTEHAIRPTSVRILVMRAIMQRKGAFCLYDIEADVPTLDRSSIFRALRLFTQHHLLHEIDDGSGFCKYCLCQCKDHNHHLNHVHFTCTKCGKTFCIEEQKIPVVTLPEGFVQEEAEYVIKGICPDCKR